MYVLPDHIMVWIIPTISPNLVLQRKHIFENIYFADVWVGPSMATGVMRRFPVTVFREDLDILPLCSIADHIPTYRYIIGLKGLLARTPSAAVMFLEDFVPNFLSQIGIACVDDLNVLSKVTPMIMV